MLIAVLTSCAEVVPGSHFLIPRIRTFRLEWKTCKYNACLWRYRTDQLGLLYGTFKHAISLVMNGAGDNQRLVLCFRTGIEGQYPAGWVFINRLSRENEQHFPQIALFCQPFLLELGIGLQREEIVGFYWNLPLCRLCLLSWNGAGIHTCMHTGNVAAQLSWTQHRLAYLPQE